MTPTPAENAVRQLERSERGQMTCKLLLEFLTSAAVRGLDEKNSQAVQFLAFKYLLGTGSDACAVKEALAAAVERNSWVNQ